MINLNSKIIVSFLICCLFISPVLVSCSTSDPVVDQTENQANDSAVDQDVVTLDFEEVPLYNKPQQSSVLAPTMPGTVVYNATGLIIDASNISQGYVAIKYTGKNSKIKVQVTKAKVTYTYNINKRDAYEIFPLSEGNGKYTVKVFENISGTQYSQLYSKELDVALANQFLPFLYPNQYVNFTANTTAVKKGIEITEGKTNELEVVDAVYNYVVDNFSYDYDKAANVVSGYLPDLDKVFKEKKGICFDYASVMASMLRSQNIPTKLVVGYTGEIYHAWINVYVESQGWIDGIIFFNGEKWEMMDPTFASTGKKSESIMKYINNNANYQAKYAY